MILHNLTQSSTVTFLVTFVTLRHFLVTIVTLRDPFW